MFFVDEKFRQKRSTQDPSTKKRNLGHPAAKFDELMGRLEALASDRKAVVRILET